MITLREYLDKDGAGEQLKDPSVLMDRQGMPFWDAFLHKLNIALGTYYGSDRVFGFTKMWAMMMRADDGVLDGIIPVFYALLLSVTALVITLINVNQKELAAAIIVSSAGLLYATYWASLQKGER